MKDQDVVVADAAAKILYEWTGKVHDIEANKRVPRGIPSIESADEQMSATFEIDNGKNFHVSFNGDRAPLARARFAALAMQGYYGGLVFHRVYPNAYVQGGSPGASEYCGDCSFLTDEVGPPSHERGTIGMSNRGRDLGDGQLFISLVDNLAFDDVFTVLGSVSPPDWAAVDEIQEGDRIIRVIVRTRPRKR